MSRFPNFESFVQRGETLRVFWRRLRVFYPRDKTRKPRRDCLGGFTETVLSRQHG